MKTVFAAVVLGVAMLAPPTLAAPAASMQSSARADRLVQMLAGDDALIAVTTRLFDKHIESNAGLPPERAAIFAQNPALKKQVAGQIRVELAGMLKRELPTLRTQLSALLTSEMTAQEIGDTLTFFETPTGKKLLSGAFQQIGDSGARDENEAKQAAMAGVMASIAPEDYPALMAFGASTAAKKMQSLNPKISATSRTWTESLMARNQSRLMRMVESSVAEYQAKKK